MVAMPTGTGKTFLMVAQVYRLLESKLVRKILFLVDRKALAAQAVREFNAFNTPNGNKFTQEYEVYSQRFQREDFGDDFPFDPKVLPNEYLTAPKLSHTFVYVATIQRMARNLFGAEAAFPQTDDEGSGDGDKLDIPIYAFDLIVADECHRGYSAQELSIWRDTLQHFDAIRIGLTATPASHSVAVFGEPVFRYGVEQAIRDDFLVDYEAVAIKSKVRINGVFLKEGERVGRIDTETGEELFDDVEDERTFSAEEVEREITAPDSNRKIIEEVAKHAYAHEAQTDRFPKILIFTVNAAARVLEPFEATLLEAAKFYAEHLSRVNKSETVAKVVKEILASKEHDNLRPRYLSDLRVRLNRFAESFGERKIASLTAGEIDGWLRGLQVKPLTRNTFRLRLSTLFEFAIIRGWCQKNLMAEVPKIRASASAIGVLTPEEFARLP
jgi:type I site-specific restriction endonuclease